MWTLLSQGDTDKTVASRASYHLLQLLQSHPAMKSVVVREVSSLVLVPPPAKVIAPSKQAKKQQKKKGKGKAPPMAKKTTVFDTARDDSGNLHARYYGIITLNQTTLTVRDGEVAGKLVEVYFEVFKGILGDGKGKEEEEPIEKDEAGASEAGKAGKEHKGKGAWKGKGKKSDPKEDEVEDSDAKMIAAVLSGVNRALPFAKIDENVYVLALIALSLHLSARLIDAACELICYSLFPSTLK
jgi:ribosome biogenesis protein MAK21